MLIADARNRKYFLCVGWHKLNDLLFDITLVQLAQNTRKRIHEPLLPGSDEQLVETDLARRLGSGQAAMVGALFAVGQVAHVGTEDSLTFLGFSEDQPKTMLTSAVMS